jgi:hypothetical protein
MIPAKNTKSKSKAKDAVFAFPAPDDWKNIVRDLGLTKVQKNDLDITVRHVLADIEKNRAGPPRDILVAALKRLEKVLGAVQSEMARSKDLTRHLLPNSTLQFIGESFTFTAVGQAIGQDVFPIGQDYSIQSMIEKSNLVSIADLENQFRDDRKYLGLKYGGETLRHFIDTIHSDLKSWVELDRSNKGGRPADVYRQYIIRRLAERSPWIIGIRATTTAKGKFHKLCVAVLPACGFRSQGIEKAIEAVLKKMSGKKKAVLKKASGKKKAVLEKMSGEKKKKERG